MKFLIKNVSNRFQNLLEKCFRNLGNVKYTNFLNDLKNIQKIAKFKCRICQNYENGRIFKL